MRLSTVGGTISKLHVPKLTPWACMDWCIKTVRVHTRSIVLIRTEHTQTVGKVVIKANRRQSDRTPYVTTRNPRIDNARTRRYNAREQAVADRIALESTARVALLMREANG